MAAMPLPMPENCQGRNRLYYSYLERLLLGNPEESVRDMGQSRPNFGTPLIAKKSETQEKNV